MFSLLLVQDRTVDWRESGVGEVREGRLRLQTRVRVGVGGGEGEGMDEGLVLSCPVQYKTTDIYRCGCSAHEGGDGGVPSSSSSG
jgi:hypothetical protein